MQNCTVIVVTIDNIRSLLLLLLFLSLVLLSLLLFIIIIIIVIIITIIIIIIIIKAKDMNGNKTRNKLYILFFFVAIIGIRHWRLMSDPYVCMVVDAFAIVFTGF